MFQTLPHVASAGISYGHLFRAALADVALLVIPQQHQQNGVTKIKCHARPFPPGAGTSLTTPHCPWQSFPRSFSTKSLLWSRQGEEGGERERDNQHETVESDLNPN